MAADEQVGDPRMGASAGDLEMAIVILDDVHKRFAFYSQATWVRKKTQTELIWESQKNQQKIPRLV